MFTVRPGLCLFVAGARLLDACGAPVSIEVDRKEKRMTLRFDSSLTTRDRVMAAVDDVVASIP
jgi:hypothetical protein